MANIQQLIPVLEVIHRRPSVGLVARVYSAASKMSLTVATIKTRFPLATDIAFGTCAYGLGDYLCQRVEQRGGYDKFRWDIGRTRRMALFALMVNAPAGWLWYNRFNGGIALLQRSAFLKARYNRLEAGNQLWKINFAQVFMTQTIIAPHLCWGFLAFDSYLSNSSVKSTLQDKFLMTYASNWAYWPLLDFLNFRFVPILWRPIVMMTTDLGWGMILSFIQHNG